MKRIPKSERTRKLAEKCYPLFFWRFCFVCRREFRREAGWKGRLGLYRGKYGWYHICSECAPTEKQADDLFEDKEFYLSRTR